MNRLIWFRDFAYKWAGFWVVLVTVLAGWTYYQGRTTDRKFEALRGGICRLVDVSNKAVPKNREIYEGQIQRARIRLAYDLSHDSPTLVTADRDSIAANKRALKRTHTFALPGC